MNESKQQVATVFKPVIEDKVKVEQPKVEPTKEKKQPAKLVGCYV